MKKEGFKRINEKNETKRSEETRNKLTLKEK